MQKKTYLSHEAQLELARRGQAGDVEARNKLIMNFHDLIYKQAGHYCRFDRTFVHDCANACVCRLIEKFDLFDTNRGVRWITWAFNWIRQSCQAFYANNRTVIKAQRRSQCNTTPKLDAQIKAANRVKQGSTPVKTGFHSVPLQSLIVDEYEPHILTVERLDEVEATRKVLNRLDERYQQVLLRRAEGDTLKLIGEDLHLSKERVRQLEKDAKVKFREVAVRVSRPLVESFIQHGALAS
jgi:RNA polymerase primary sigma factor